MKCLLCNENAIDGVYCKLHHVESKEIIWSDNTELYTNNNKGIIAWARQLMPEYCRNLTPEHHILIYDKMLQLYHPDRINKQQRLLELIAYRGSAKSTVANTIFVAYILAHNNKKIKIKDFEGKIIEVLIQEKFVCLLSETGTMAEDFCVRIRDEFGGANQLLSYYYSVNIEDAQEDDTGVWTKNNFKFNGCYVVGVGAGQQVRGKVKGAYRPTLMIFDDIYSEKNVITEESRTKVKNWFHKAAFNSLDDILGKCVMLGTIVHDDTVLVELKKNSSWTTIEIPIMNVDEFHEIITKVDYDKHNRKCNLPFDDIESPEIKGKKQKEYFDKIQNEKDWKLTWKDRHDLYFIVLKFKDLIESNSLDSFYQEYFHITSAPGERKFQKYMFQRVTNIQIKYENGFTWLLDPNLSDKWIIVNIELTLDTSAGKVKSDPSVITIAALTSDKRIYILNQVSGQWSIRDDIAVSDNRSNLVCLDKTKAIRIGFVDELFRQSLIYKPNRIKIAVAGTELNYHTETKRIFSVNNNYTQIIADKQTAVEGSKIERILNRALPYYEARQVFHCFEATSLEYQLEYLGKTKNDDHADSMSSIFFQPQFPEEIKYEEINPSYSIEDNEYLELSNSQFDWQLN